MPTASKSITGHESGNLNNSENSLYKSQKRIVLAEYIIAESRVGNTKTRLSRGMRRTGWDVEAFRRLKLQKIRKEYEGEKKCTRRER